MRSSSLIVSALLFLLLLSGCANIQSNELGTLATTYNGITKQQALNSVHTSPKTQMFIRALLSEYGVTDWAFFADPNNAYRGQRGLDCQYYLAGRNSKARVTINITFGTQQHLHHNKGCSSVFYMREAIISRKEAISSSFSQVVSKNLSTKKISVGRIRMSIGTLSVASASSAKAALDNLKYAPNSVGSGSIKSIFTPANPISMDVKAIQSSSASGQTLVLDKNPIIPQGIIVTPICKGTDCDDEARDAAAAFGGHLESTVATGVAVGVAVVSCRAKTMCGWSLGGAGVALSANIRSTYNSARKLTDLFNCWGDERLEDRYCP